MLILELTEQQKNSFIDLVDMLLRTNGVAALSKSVELINVLNSARVKSSETDVVRGNI